MKIDLDSLTLWALEDGEFITDAGELLGKRMKARIRGAMHPVVVASEAGLTLLDAGFGPEIPETLREKYELRRSQTLPEHLRASGHDPRDVTRIALSHLDADHVGWALNSMEFPAATVYVQRAAIEEARSLPEGSNRRLALPALEKLLEEGRCQMMEGTAQVAPGVRAELREGHARGHQVFWLGDSEALFTADLAPAKMWFDPSLVSAADSDPELARKNRSEALQRAAELEVPVILYHEPTAPVVIVEQKDGSFIASPYDA